MTKNIGTMAEWQKALDDLSTERKEEVPEGWINAREYSEAPETRCDVSTAQKHLRELLLGEKIECREFNRVRYYRLKKR